jgi:flagellar hook protein FlgE
MIEGDGFFVTRAGTENLYTRAGSFDFDGEGKLVTPNGGVLQGWMANAAGVVNPNGPTGDLSVPYGQIVNPKQSTTGALGGNLPAGAATGDTFQTGVTMYDSQGVEQKVFYNFTKTATANTWSLDIKHADGTSLVTGATVAFNAAGALTTPAAPGTLAAFTPPAATYPSWTGPVTIDVAALTQFGGANTVTAPEQNGYALGSLQSFTLGNDGTIMGVYSNGLRQPLGQLALASFNNPSGLEKAGSSTFRVGVNSGAAAVGLAGVGGRGVLNSGALEMSNVDLAEEFTGLIVAQRGFQANSRVITTSDELLQDLVNLKR